MHILPCSFSILDVLRGYSWPPHTPSFTSESKIAKGESVTGINTYVLWCRDMTASVEANQPSENERTVLHHNKYSKVEKAMVLGKKKKISETKCISLMSKGVFIYRARDFNLIDHFTF